MARASREPRATRAAEAGRATGRSRRAFTLVELLVVLVIVMILSGLTLAALATARRGAKIDSTRNTIRKIHEIVMPQYESYQRRRVPSADPLNRLVTIRQLIVLEMPDSWKDVLSSVAPLPGSSQAYAATKNALNMVLATAGKPAVDAEYGDAECLYMIASRGTGDPDAMERFRTEEVGDTDKDGAPEFIDAWGKPIRFLRWAPGFSASAGTPGVRTTSTTTTTGVSVVQFADPVNFHDPLDPMRKDPLGYALIPLIVSGGPDGSIGFQLFNGQLSDGWAVASLPSVVGSAYGSPDGSGSHADNITNHDLTKK